MVGCVHKQKRFAFYLCPRKSWSVCTEKMSSSAWRQKTCMSGGHHIRRERHHQCRDHRHLLYFWLCWQGAEQVPLACWPLQCAPVAPGERGSNLHKAMRLQFLLGLSWELACLVLHGALKIVPLPAKKAKRLLSKTAEICNAPWGIHRGRTWGWVAFQEYIRNIRSSDLFLPNSPAVAFLNHFCA